MRKLASIQKISAIEPIQGADKIELAHVLGWQCVVKKNEFKVGDDCVYFEIDSFLPVREEFEFLRKSSYKNSELLGEGFRLKTLKLRGQLSQGLCLPVSIIEDEGWRGLPEGTDVTELLGVRKWEIPEKATTGGTIIGNLPACVPHTDETRVQSEPGLLDEFAGKPYYITTKMDGSSHSIAYDKDGFHVCGHNYEYADDGKCSFYEFVKSRGILKEFRSFIETKKLVHGEDSYSFVIQGEFCAPGIQSNKLKLKTPAWYVFTVIENGERYGLSDMMDVCLSLNLDGVPVEEIQKDGQDLTYHYPDVQAILNRAKGDYPNGGPKEGLVVRPLKPCRSEILDNWLSMKVINNEYFLKEKK